MWRQCQCVGYLQVVSKTKNIDRLQIRTQTRLRLFSKDSRQQMAPLLYGLELHMHQEMQWRTQDFGEEGLGHVNGGNQPRPLANL